VAVGRKMVVTGRSMVTNTRVARQLGYLHIKDEDIIDAYEVDDIPDDKIVVLCTGSQGEPLSALSRMANGEHKSLSITERDTVIISATPVPGNEKSVAGIVNALSKIGCAIYDKNQSLVHVSGHGSQEELKLMIAMVKPTYFMPVHGEAMHLRAHARLARQMGIPAENIFISDNGDALEMYNHVVRRTDPVDSGVVYVDGLSVTDADPVVLRDRQKLSKDGIVTCVVTVSHRSHKARNIEIYSRGVSFANDEELARDAQEVVLSRVDKNTDADVGVDQLRKGVRNGLSNFLWNRTHTRPMVIPVVMEV
jgi:ribonuclease J